MTFLLASDVRNIEDSFYNLLIDTPGTKEKKQNFFLKRHHIKIPRTNYDLMWDSLIERYGRAVTGEVIFDLVLNFADERTLELFKRVKNEDDITLREEERNLVVDLFYFNGNPKRVCELLLEYIDYINFKFNDKEKEKNVKIIKRESEDFEYDVALSFAGEDREIAEKLANKFRSVDIRVFYDEFYKAKLWGKNLSQYFKKVYGSKTRYVMPLISQYYPVKDWTNFEFSIARDEAKTRKTEFILPVRLDNTGIYGLKDNIAYIDYNIEKIDGIVQKLQCKLDNINDAVIKEKSFVLKDVFLVYENGCFIAHHTRRLKPDYDHHIMTSMLTMIQSFVKDSFRDESDWGLRNISFGESQIVIERGKNVFLAAVYKGDYQKEFSEKMKGVIKDVEQEYGEVLDEWNGDLDLLRGIKDFLAPLFLSQEEINKREKDKED